MEFKRANTYLAVFFFARKKYIELAVNHGMAINLEAPDLYQRYQEGKFPSEGWEQESEAAAIEAASQVSRGLWGSFWAISVAALLASLVGFYYGTIHPALTINYGAAFSCLARIAHR